MQSRQVVSGPSRQEKERAVKIGTVKQDNSSDDRMTRISQPVHREAHGCILSSPQHVVGQAKLPYSSEYRQQGSCNEGNASLKPRDLVRILNKRARLPDKDSCISSKDFVDSIRERLDQNCQPSVADFSTIVNKLSRELERFSSSTYDWYLKWLCRWLPEMDSPDDFSMANVVNGIGRLSGVKGHKVIVLIANWVVRHLGWITPTKAIGIANTVNGLARLGMGSRRDVVGVVGPWVVKYLPHAICPQAIEIANTVNGLAQLGMGRDAAVVGVVGPWVSNIYPMRLVLR